MANLENSVNSEYFNEFLENDCPSPGGENKVPVPEEDLVFCDFKECNERGQYIRCYFDLYKNCDIYKKREFYKGK